MILTNERVCGAQPVHTTEEAMASMERMLPADGDDGKFLL